MQSKCKDLLEMAFPSAKIKSKKGELRFNVEMLNSESLNSLSIIEGMSKDLYIKRSGTGIVIILIF